MFPEGIAQHPMPAWLHRDIYNGSNIKHSIAEYNHWTLSTIVPVNPVGISVLSAPTCCQQLLGQPTG
jgi:hypothetical protein